MKLIRGWESQYAPDVTGGVRLSKAEVYRAIQEEEGLGDVREGEIRVGLPATIKTTGSSDSLPPVSVTVDLAADEPPLVAEDLQPGEIREIQQHVKVEDSALGSPFLFCLSREPTTKTGWETLRDALPERYDMWTMTENIYDLNFEIECGIRRWLAVNELTRHQISRYRGWVEYSYDTIPPSLDLDSFGEALHLTRWFRKRKQYANQQEYRLAWQLTCPQWQNLPDSIDIELTRTGLGMFKPWLPPAH